MQAVGLDSVWFQRPSAVTPFKALLGVAITVKDNRVFQESYHDEMSNVFREMGFERKKRIYKAAFLAEQLYANANMFIKNFISKITPQLLRINVYYTFYPVGTISQIWTCRESYPRAYSPEKFMDHIYNAYPHYCIWQYTRSYPDCTHYLYESDFFSGKISPAWEKVRRLPNLKLFYNGGQCNPLISLADLFLRLICETMPGRLGRMNLGRCLNDAIGDVPLFSHFMGPRIDYLREMAFTQRRDFLTRQYVKRPLYWVFWKPFTTTSEEIKLLEWKSSYNAMVTEVELNNGCFRMYEPSDITQILDKTQDKACLMNEEARPMLDAFLSFAPDIEVLDFRSD